MNDVAFIALDPPRSRKEVALEVVRSHINTWLKSVTEPRKQQLRSQFDALMEEIEALGLSPGTLDKQFLECAQELRRHRRLAVAAGVERYRVLMRKDGMKHEIALSEASDLAMAELLSTFSVQDKQRNGADSS